MVWEINMGVCPRLEFNNIMFIIVWGITFIFLVHLSFFLCNSIAKDLGQS